MVPRSTLALRLLNGQVYRYDYKIQTFVPTTFRVIIVCCKDCASNFLLSDTVSFIQADFTLYVVLVFCCLSVDSILYLMSLMDFLVHISKYVVVLKTPAPFAGLLLSSPYVIKLTNNFLCTLWWLRVRKNKVLNHFYRDFCC